MLARVITAAAVALLWLHGPRAWFESTAAEPTWPELPPANARVELPAQEWPLRPGDRTIQVLVHYPGGQLANVGSRTGVMLSLHNWGGVDCVGTADPQVLANELDVVALCVNYLQSGKVDSIDGPEPYDCGYLQALDALRALYWADQRLVARGTSFARDRFFSTGGSGGGNVTLMANKLAPRTFACVVDLCGMKLLTDDVAFALPGGSELNARYRREATHPYHMTRDAQEIRWIGNPRHLQAMKNLGAATRIICVHGSDDRTCPFSDAQSFVANARAAGLPVEPFFVQKADIDGKVFTSTGHALGDRTRIVLQVAGKYLRADSPDSLRRQGPSDFERREEIRYPTPQGQFVISYRDGYPIGRFEPAAPPPDYRDHFDLLHHLDDAGKRHEVRDAADWLRRREHIVEHLQQVMGLLPGPLQRVPLDVRIVEEARIGNLVRRKVTYQSDPDDRVAAYLFLPAEKPARRLPAVLCLQQTTNVGKEEPAGVSGDQELAYALELAERGFVTLAPDYPSFGEHAYDFGFEHGYASGSMKAIWDNIRAVDLLGELEQVDAARIGCIGHSLGGHNGLFTAVFEPRIKAIVSSCGFTTFLKDDVPSWTGPRYMPRIATQYGNDANRVPFDFTEIVAAISPRALLAVAAEQDDDFNASGVREVISAARRVYELHAAGDRLDAHYPDAPHSFPREARQRAYEFLERHLGGE